MIPKGWEKRPAKEIFKSISEKNYPGEELLSATQENGVIPRRQLHARVTMPTKNLQTFKRVLKEDFVISLRSFQGGLEYSNYQGIVSPAYTVLRKIIPICGNFFKYYFKTKSFINDLDSSVVGVREGKQISYKYFSVIKILLPPFTEQKRIAEILTSVDDAIQATEKVIKQTKQVKQGLLQDLLSRGIGHSKFKKTEIGEIPESWNFKIIKDIAIFVGRGKAPKYVDVESDTIAINQKCIRHGRVNTSFGRFHDTDKIIHKSAILREHDICVNSTGTGTVGRSALWVPEVDKQYFADTHVTIIRSDRSSVDPIFFNQLLQSSFIQKRLAVECFIGSTKQIELNKSSLQFFKLLLPPLLEQKRITKILTSVDDKIQAEETKLKQIKQLKQGLMQDLLTGRVRVKGVQ